MKLHLLNRASVKHTSFGVEKHSYPHFLKVWHYHPELELVLSLKGGGTRFVGDSMDTFCFGDIVLIGKNLPHMWLSDKIYFEPDSKLISESIVFHFRENFLGNDFFETPEMTMIAKLIERSKYGIKFKNTDERIRSLMFEILDKKGVSKILSFLEVLNILAEHEDYELLASKGFINTNDLPDNKSFKKVYEYIFKNFNSQISLEDVSKIAHMNPSAFSRSFKRVNNKTFSRYLNEIRIGFACKLLIEEKYNITHICYESGYNSPSNFNRQFKLITGTTPSQYLSERSTNKTKE